jgi:hypothetical protein
MSDLNAIALEHDFGQSGCYREAMAQKVERLTGKLPAVCLGNFTIFLFGHNPMLGLWPQQSTK